MNPPFLYVVTSSASTADPVPKPLMNADQRKFSGRGAAGHSREAVAAVSRVRKIMVQCSHQKRKAA